MICNSSIHELSKMLDGESSSSISTASATPATSAVGEKANEAAFFQ